MLIRLDLHVVNTPIIRRHNGGGLFSKKGALVWQSSYRSIILIYYRRQK
jgi:hypothetical protein